MSNQRLIEANILGYPLGRIDGESISKDRYEVLEPGNGGVLARFPDRNSAEKFIVSRELEAIKGLPRNPAY